MRQLRQPKTRIFVGCEGQSEHGYTTFLFELARDRDLPVVLERHVLRRGEPLSRLERAADLIRIEEQKRGEFLYRFAFLDSDQREQDPVRADRAEQLANQLDLRIIWQTPDHEGLLLHHFADAPRRRPRTKADAIHAVRARWDGYEKSLPARDYRRRLSMEDVERAGGVHPGLAFFLATIGLITA